MKKILDIGGADGAFVFMKAQEHPEHLYTNVDISFPRQHDTPENVVLYFKGETLLRALGYAHFGEPVNTWPMVIKRNEEPSIMGEIRKVISDPRKQLAHLMANLNNELEQDLTFLFFPDSQYFEFEGIDQGRKYECFWEYDEDTVVEMRAKEVLSYTPSHEMVAFLERVTQNIHGRQADGTNLPFPKNEFDHVYMNGVTGDQVPLIVSEGKRVSKENRVLDYSDTPITV